MVRDDVRRAVLGAADRHRRLRGRSPRAPPQLRRLTAAAPAAPLRPEARRSIGTLEFQPNAGCVVGHQRASGTSPRAGETDPLPRARTPKATFSSRWTRPSAPQNRLGESGRKLSRGKPGCSWSRFTGCASAACVWSPEAMRSPLPLAQRIANPWFPWFGRPADSRLTRRARARPWRYGLDHPAFVSGLDIAEWRQQPDRRTGVEATGPGSSRRRLTRSPTLRLRQTETSPIQASADTSGIEERERVFRLSSHVFPPANKMKPDTCLPCGRVAGEHSLQGGDGSSETVSAS